MNSNTVMVPTVHSELGASSYSRWKECPGSVALSRGIEKKSSIYAEEGTLAHDVAAVLLANQTPHPEPSEEMMEAVQVYLDYIESLRSQKPDFEAIEQKFDLSQLHPKLFGTGDYVCYFAETKTLHVVDYKHGAGVAVEVVEKENDGTEVGNEQLMYYGVGALYQNNFPIRKLVLTVVQPRCYHDKGPIRSWETNPANIMEYEATLVEDAVKTEQSNAPLKTGDHCRWCAAQAICPAKQKQAIEVARDVFAPTETYDPIKLANTLRQLDQVESWCKSVRSFAYSEAEAGRIPPGFKLVDKRATRKWIEGVDAKKLAATFTLRKESDFYSPAELISPAQCEKIISKGEKNFLEELTLKISSGKNLVEDNEKNSGRMAIAPKAAEVFELL